MLNILLVDDEKLERATFKKILTKIDIETEIIGEATDGKTAIKLARELKPDIIFIDEIMPRLSGIEAANIIKKEQPNIFIYLMFSYTDSERVFNNKKINGTISKPIRRKHVDSILSIYKMNDEERLFSKDGLVKQLLETIHFEDYRESKYRLRNLEQQLLKVNREIKQIERAMEIIKDKILAVCEAKKLPVSRQKWESKITFYNVGSLLGSLLKDIFQSILENKRVTSNNEIKMILNYIEMHYKEGVSLEEVAEFVHLSPNYVSRLFRKEVEMTFVNYVTDRKIEHAKYLLKHTNQPVVNIAMELSFQEHTYFSKVFKKSVGQSPSEYRSQFRQQKQNFPHYYNIKTSKNWYI